MRIERTTRSPIRHNRHKTLTRTGLGACAALALLFAASELREMMPEFDAGGLAQSLRQSAWDQALSHSTEAASWAFQDTTQPMSRLPQGKVERLGLSAALTDTAIESAKLEPAKPRTAQQRNRIATSMEGDIALGDVSSGTVGIGDSITFTASDGSTCVYRVTGRQVVDPHLASGQAEGANAQAGLFDCNELDDLIVKASRQTQKADPLPQDDQRKL